jgi:uroporphyrin-III C-methyltransferase / precorrin-2 dehydrogenase / sirohydrochlorin ferrochelatase
MHSLPLFVRLAGRPVALIGSGPAADAKRRLLERAGATIVGEADAVALAIVADGDEAATARLKARGVLVNVVDRPELCDFTLPAIVDRSPVIVAVGTGGASAGLAKALRQRLETLLPASLGPLATTLETARGTMRARWPDAVERRHALDAGFATGGALDPLAEGHDVAGWLDTTVTPPARHEVIRLTSPDPDELTLRAARLLGEADTIWHDAAVPTAILDRSRADAERHIWSVPQLTAGADRPGLTLEVRFA